MKTLDNLYKYCSRLNPNAEIINYNDEVTYVKNIFKDPDSMVGFQSLLSKWESCGNAKPGIMSLKIPYWTGNDIANVILNIGDKIDYKRNEVEFYYFYWNNVCVDSDVESLISNNCLLPHTDPGPDREIVNIIGLVNLNKRPVKTGFWSFYGNIVADTDEINDDYCEYSSNIDYDNINEKTNNGILDNVFNVEYNYNEAIFYNACCFHQPIIDKYYTRENPRIMMRFSFVLDNEDSECYDD